MYPFHYSYLLLKTNHSSRRPESAPTAANHREVGSAVDRQMLVLLVVKTGATLSYGDRSVSIGTIAIGSLASLSRCTLGNNSASTRL